MQILIHKPHWTSRTWSWQDRPQASALLAAVERPDRGFDAVVVGEYERAFYGDQFEAVVTRLNALGVQVWLPEAGGPVELGSPVHQALMVLLGAQAQREVVRARHRVKAAMGAQTRSEGRFLGGRPPYGYRLADAGPHPNTTHAQWGDVFTCWNRIPKPHRGSGGCSPSEHVAGQSRRWHGNSTTAVCPAQPRPTRPAIRTSQQGGGSHAPSH